MKFTLLQALNRARARRRAAIVLTPMEEGAQQLICETGLDSLEDAALAQVLRAHFRSGRSEMVTIADKKVFLHTHVPRPRLCLVGAVHIAQSLAPMASAVGFDVRVIDPRTAFATPERFGTVDLVPAWPDDAFARQPLDPYTALAALTHDPKIDDPALLCALATGCFYIGALGSRKTHAARLERLRTAGMKRPIWHGSPHP